MRDLHITIDLDVAFGRPCIEGTRITAEIVTRRFMAGESASMLTLDYDVPKIYIEDAIRFEMRLLRGE